MLAIGAIPVDRSKLPPGKLGTDVTVKRMAQLAMGQWGARSPRIRALAIEILRRAFVTEKNYRGEMVAIHNWVRDNVRYTRDTHGQETLVTPEYLVSDNPGSFAGDCDDKSMLEAALLGAIGIPTRFVVIGVQPDRYSHVYLQALIQDEWIALDPIMRERPAGWELPNPAIKKVYPENAPEGFAMHGDMGYVAEPRIHSFLTPEPPPPPEPAPYVAMNSMMDTNEAIDPQMAYPPGQNLPQYLGPGRMQDIGQKGMGLIDPGAMAMRPRPNMQRRPVAAQPEGVDAMFGRPARLFNGLPAMHFGPRSLAERTPGRPVAVSGLGASDPPPLAPPSKPWLAVAVAAGLAYFVLLRNR